MWHYTARQPCKGGEALDGSIDPIQTAADLADVTIKKGAAAILLVVSSCHQRYELSDDIATMGDGRRHYDSSTAGLSPNRVPSRI